MGIKAPDLKSEFNKVRIIYLEGFSLYQNYSYMKDIHKVEELTYFTNSIYHNQDDNRIGLEKILKKVKNCNSKRSWEKVIPTLSLFSPYKTVPNRTDTNLLDLVELSKKEGRKTRKKYFDNITSHQEKEVFNLIKGLDDMHSNNVSYNSIEDFLTQAGIQDELIEGNRDLWDFARHLEHNEVVSYNETYKLVDKNGERWVLKVTDVEHKAKIEAAANYYLSDHFSFIVPGMSPDPIKINGLYLTLQKDVSDREDLLIKQSIDYWISSLALFHKEAEHILPSQGIIVPDHEVIDFDIMKNIYDISDKSHELTFDSEKIKDAIDYLKSTESKYLVHGDVKNDNRLGSMLIDLELCGKGNPSIDLALILMQYNVPKENWVKHLQDYLTIRGSEDHMKELTELSKGIEYAATYIGCKECWGSHTRTITKQTTKDGRLLRKYLLSIAA